MTTGFPRPGAARARAALGRLLAVAVLAQAACAAAFEPQRTFPDTWDGIRVFADQLPSLSVAQRQFAASHYVGTQKQTSNLIDAIRAYNPDFIMIQYRLGVRESGHECTYIHNDTWSTDWDTIDPHEDWFVHDDQGNRVYQLYNGWLEEYCMDCSGLIEGNTTYGWKEYWSDCVLSDVTASHGDGVFADSTHLPYAVPSSLWDSPMGSPPHTAYIPHLEAFYDYVYQRFDEANQYYIPNIGGLCTTVDTTSGYYEDVHGAMVEGFGTKLSNYDWKLQQNRTLRLLGNGKIYIAQSSVEDYTDVPGRLWLLSNFLLLKHDRSYLNLCGAGSQMHWWPEYDLDIGPPAEAGVPGNVSAMRDASGVYARRYEHGLVLVNPTDQARTYGLGEELAYVLVTPYGGGRVLSNGQLERDSGLIYTRQLGGVTLDDWSGAVLVATVAGDVNLDWVVNYLDLGLLATNYGASGATWTDGDVDGNGQVNYLDLGILASNYNQAAGLSGASSSGRAAAVPEPIGLLLVAAGALGLAGRRRRRAA